MLLLSQAVTPDVIQAFLRNKAVDVAAQKVPDSAVSHASSSVQLVLSLQLSLFLFHPSQLCILFFQGRSLSWSELKSKLETF